MLFHFKQYPMDPSLLLEKSFCSTTGSLAWECLVRVGPSAGMSVSAGEKWVLAAASWVHLAPCM